MVVGLTDNHRFAGLLVQRNQLGIETIHHVTADNSGQLQVGPELVPENPPQSLSFGLEVVLDGQFRPKVTGKFQGSHHQLYDWSFRGPTRLHFENLGPVDIPAKPQAAFQLGRFMVIGSNEHVDSAYREARALVK